MNSMKNQFDQPADCMRSLPTTSLNYDISRVDAAHVDCRHRDQSVSEESAWTLDDIVTGGRGQSGCKSDGCQVVLKSFSIVEF